MDFDQLVADVLDHGPMLTSNGAPIAANTFTVGGSILGIDPSITPPFLMETVFAGVGSFNGTQAPVTTLQVRPAPSWARAVVRRINVRPRESS
jgi:hypothetical protein